MCLLPFQLFYFLLFYWLVSIEIGGVVETPGDVRSASLLSPLRGGVFFSRCVMQLAGPLVALAFDVGLGSSFSLRDSKARSLESIGSLSLRYSPFVGVFRASLSFTSDALFTDSVNPPGRARPAPKRVVQYTPRSAIARGLK